MPDLRARVGWNLRKLADRIDHTVAYLGDEEYEKAHAEADNGL